jgi:hypothetical protein
MLRRTSFAQQSEEPAKLVRKTSLYSSAPKIMSSESRIGEFKLGKLLGVGGFSKVVVGYHIPSGKKVRLRHLIYFLFRFTDKISKGSYQGN